MGRRWLPWPPRSRKGTLTEFILANVKAVRVKGSHWKITIGPDSPFTYDFWGTDQQVQEEARERDEEAQRVRRQAAKAWRAKQALQRVHEEDRHSGSSIQNCPRCRAYLRKLGGQL